MNPTDGAVQPLFFLMILFTVVYYSHPGFGLFLPVDTAFRRGRFVINVESLFTLVFSDLQV